MTEAELKLSEFSGLFQLSADELTDLYCTGSGDKEHRDELVGCEWWCSSSNVSHDFSLHQVPLLPCHQSASSSLTFCLRNSWRHIDWHRLGCRLWRQVYAWRSSVRLQSSWRPGRVVSTVLLTTSRLQGEWYSLSPCWVHVFPLHLDLSFLG